MNLPLVSRLFSFAGKLSGAALETAYSEKPGPDEILRSNLPPQRSQGLKVAWNLTFQYIHYQISRNEILILASYKNQVEKIWLIVDVNIYPQIYYCAPRSSVGVKGEIQMIQGGEIYLKDCLLDFKS